MIFCKMESSLHQANIFFMERHSETHQEHRVEENLPFNSLPYLKKGDSNVYLEQFLGSQVAVKQEENEQNKANAFSQEVNNLSRSRKRKPSSSPSNFHNFQKHLTTCLRKSIDISSSQTVQQIPPAALLLWKEFKESANCSKKILHYIFGENNEHKITDNSLRSCKLLKLYQSFGEQAMTNARVYLTKEALRQIRDGKLGQYIQQKQIKDKIIFQKYVTIFIQQLESGFLNKRLPRDKIMKLQKND